MSQLSHEYPDQPEMWGGAGESEMDFTDYPPQSTCECGETDLREDMHKCWDCEEYTCQQCWKDFHRCSSCGAGPEPMDLDDCA